MRKVVLVYAQDVVGNNKFLVQFEDGQIRFTSYYFLLHICSQEEFGQEENETILDLLKNKRVNY